MVVIIAAPLSVVSMMMEGENGSITGQTRAVGAATANPRVITTAPDQTDPLHIRYHPRSLLVGYRHLLASLGLEVVYRHRPLRRISAMAMVLTATVMPAVGATMEVHMETRDTTSGMRPKLHSTRITGASTMAHLRGTKGEIVDPMTMGGTIAVAVDMVIGKRL
jgi:hypothetical protein